MRVLTVRGAPSRRKTLVAARASVGPTMAPSVSAAAQLRVGIAACTTAPTMTIVKITSPTDRRTSGARFARRSRSGDSAAALNSSGGRNTIRTRSGSSSMRGRPGTKARPSPPRTSSVGYGTPRRRATSNRIAMATRIARTAVRASRVDLSRRRRAASPAPPADRLGPLARPEAQPGSSHSSRPLVVIAALPREADGGRARRLAARAMEVPARSVGGKAKEALRSWSDRRASPDARARHGPLASWPRLDEPPDERERAIGDVAPTAIDRERMSPTGDLQDLRDTLVPLLLLVRGVCDGPRHGVIELPVHDEQRPAVRVLRVDLRLCPWVEVRKRRLKERLAGSRDRKG